MKALLGFRPETGAKGSPKAKWKANRRVKAWYKAETRQWWLVVDKLSGGQFVESGGGWCMALADLRRIEHASVGREDAQPFQHGQVVEYRYGPLALSLHAAPPKKTSWHLAFPSEEDKFRWLAWLATFREHMRLDTGMLDAAGVPAGPAGSTRRGPLSLSHTDPALAPSLRRPPPIAHLPPAPPASQQQQPPRPPSPRQQQQQQRPQPRAPAPEAPAAQSRERSPVRTGRVPPTTTHYTQAHEAGGDTITIQPPGSPGVNPSLFNGETRIDGLDGREYSYVEFHDYYGPRASPAKWRASALGASGSVSRSPISPERDVSYNNVVSPPTATFKPRTLEGVHTQNEFYYATPAALSFRDFGASTHPGAAAPPPTGRYL